MAKADRSSRPRRRLYWIVGALFLVPVAVFVIGASFWAGGSALLAYTSTNEYCTSCHELTVVAEEYHASSHFSNASGVRATCADCHVPEAFWPSVRDHAHAFIELKRHFEGTIATPELFEENRLRLARLVWDEMEGSNSRECRTCHVPEAFDLAAMTAEAREQMEPLMNEEDHGGNCITCHRGLVHELPDMEEAVQAAAQARMERLREAAGQDLEDVAHLFQTTPLSLSSERDSVDAQIMPGTAVQVVDRTDEHVRVRLEGWEQEGAARVMYALPGHRILSAALQPPAQEAVRRGDSITIELTGQTWTETALEGWVAAEALLPDQEDLWAYADETYRNACSICHTAHTPDHFPANQWVGQMQAMRDRSPIDSEQYRLVLRYLQMHAKDTGGAENGEDGGH